MSFPNPIGVFDSGVGGLSVLQHIRADLPQENLLYIADSRYIPYGDKSKDFIEQRSIALTRFCLEKGVKAIVVACNTATAAAISTLRSMFSLPIVGMEPAVKPAVEATKSGIIGVLATTGTLESSKFGELLHRYGKGAEVIIQPCQGLVEQVERAELSSETTRTLVKNYLSPLLERGVDTIVLGCTHYAFLTSLIRELVGQNVSIIDTGPAVSRQLRRRLEKEQLLSVENVPGGEQFWTSGPQREVQRIVSRLWNRDVDVLRLPKAFASIATISGSPNKPLQRRRQDRAPQT
jgi:glutamate racemase